MLLRTLTVKSLQTIAPYRAISSRQCKCQALGRYIRRRGQVPSPSLVVQLSVISNNDWTGDESIQDAVLRMLVDKYKPLRAGTIRTAEDKLK